MDLISLYYFQELSKDLNMTKTAERLYISQQTLSNHIQRLEQYYGTKLFYRKPSLSLTCAGEFVLSFAQVVGKEERNLKDILSDVEHQERGTLRFGASMARGTQFLPIILPAFQRRYPRVEVRFVEGLSANLEKKIANGEVDFAVVLSDRYNADLVEHEFLREEVYLCVPDGLYTPAEAGSEVKLADRGSYTLIYFVYDCPGHFSPAPPPHRPCPCALPGRPPASAPICPWWSSWSRWGSR